VTSNLVQPESIPALMPFWIPRTLLHRHSLPVLRLLARNQGSIRF